MNATEELPATRELLPREAPQQFRMRRLQVFNWGTFGGLHDVPIAERGFLFVGRSGSGKSTLLDAFTALLVPPRWADFNAAAREGDRSARERNLASYIRGAWSEQTDDESGEIARQVLRPGTTWSALALTFADGLGHTVVLVQVFWMRGAAVGSADVRRHFLVLERPFALEELADFDLDIRKLKQRLPGAFERAEFRPYCERFRRLLGIEDEKALRLLHKTQSAKSLGDLNTFLRDFMLERPETFDVADRLVAEFGELNAAHQAVITAREQVRVLQPARADHERLLAVGAERLALSAQRDALDGYRELCRRDLYVQAIEGLEVQLDGLRGESQRRKARLDAAESELQGLQAERQASGGDRLARLQTELEAQRVLRTDRLRKRDQAEEACRQLGRALPETPAGFAQLVADARREVEASGTDLQQLDERGDALRQQRGRVGAELADIAREVEAMRRQPSNIPAYMLDLRAAISAALRLPESALPFVGELLDVRPDEGAWRGALERLLRPFALSLLVAERDYAALVAHVGATHLDGQRVVFHRVDPQGLRPGRVAGLQSVLHKLTIREGEWCDWLRAEIGSRFDYACVDSARALRTTERALTRDGLIRHGTSRHEKDDRRRIDDRRSWVLGFDNRERRALFETQARELHDRLAGLNSEIESIGRVREARAARDRSCITLVNLQWSELDVAPVLDRVSQLETQVVELRDGDPVLREFSRREAALIAARDQASEARHEAEAEARRCATELERCRRQLATVEARIGAAPHAEQRPAADSHRASLQTRFADVTVSLTLDNLEEVSRQVERRFSEAIESLSAEYNLLEKRIEMSFATFRRNWPMEAGDQDATLASAADFLAKLQRLEVDNLPAHEQRFFDLLQTQSSQNIVALRQHLRLARSAILERLALVNESLGHAPFNPGTYMRIDASDRQLEEVRDFRQSLERILDRAWGDQHDQAEARFIVLQELVQRLGSVELEPQRWRELVLDVRQHMEFVGREIDARGVEVEVHRSGAGRSGGQRQKLATTCLAAALRYQLGGTDSGLPQYAPVILDEAFDKADNEFTALAMNIFVNFGFQMIVATPLKSVMTLEPFIGGAAFVDIADRRRSSVLLIEYDEGRQRLNLPRPSGADDPVDRA